MLVPSYFSSVTSRSFSMDDISSLQLTPAYSFSHLPCNTCGGFQVEQLPSMRIDKDDSFAISIQSTPITSLFPYNVDISAYISNGWVVKNLISMVEPYENSDLLEWYSDEFYSGTVSKVATSTTIGYVSSVNHSYTMNKFSLSENGSYELKSKLQERVEIDHGQKDTILELKDRVASLETTLSISMEEDDRQKDEIASLQSELASTKSTMRQQLKEAEIIELTLKKRVSNLTFKSDTITAREKEVHSQIDALKHQNTQLKVKVETFTAQIRAYEDSLQSLREEAKSIRDKQEALLKGENEAKMAMNASKCELVKVTEQLIGSRREIERLHSKLDEQTRQYLKEKADFAEESANELEQKHSEFSATLGALRKEIAKLRATNQSLADKAIHMEEEANRFRKMVGTEAEELRTQLSLEKEEKLKAIDDRDSAIRRVDRLKTELDSMVRYTDHERKKIAIVSASNASDAHKYHSQCEELRISLRQVTAHRDELLDKLKE
ncbi:hypothetical protein ADUPG1_010064 [Aduncisulcus paluster]|uniref:Uncharacterized protein n=1 Tax=Aduncisulcus paluster TaxID=2918883 RepID=A0ABQ5KYV3_9EUKA|nr:hypothetical protein ADUPG1_010064 [Aduncisulcus paluster]